MSDTPTLSLKMDLSFKTGGTLLLGSGNDLGDRTDAPVVVVRSKVYTDLQLVDRDDDNAVLTLPAGWTVTLVGKKKSGTNAPEGDLLFASSAFSAVTLGGEVWYRALVDFGATPMLTALASAASLDTICEVVVINADSSIVHRKRFEVTFTPPVYVSGAEIPAEEVINYLTAEQTAAIYIAGTPANGNFRARDRRTLQILNPDTNKFHTLIARNVDGVISLVLDQTGEG